MNLIFDKKTTLKELVTELEKMKTIEVKKIRLLDDHIEVKVGVLK